MGKRVSARNKDLVKLKKRIKKQMTYNFCKSSVFTLMVVCNGLEPLTFWL